MNIYEFIEEYYPIRDKLKELSADPFEKIINSDDLPYDLIGPDDSGRMTKLIEVSEGRYYSVYELLCYEREDFVAMHDPDLLQAYDVYMTMVDFTNPALLLLQDSVKQYQEKMKGKEM